MQFRTISAMTAQQTQDAIFLTGATGFLGTELLVRYLEGTDRTIYTLVRGRDAAEASSRLQSVLLGLFPREEAERHASRCVAVAGDLTQHRLGISTEHADLIAEDVAEVVHSAASVSFTLPLAEARAINVEGTRRVAELASRCAARGTGLRRFAHVSTAYVAGTHEGVFAEDDRSTRVRFRNTYERSKREAERALEAYASSFPVQIARPSIIVGDRRTGWTPEFNVLYWPLRAYVRGQLPAIPADPASPVDVVSVDYVADAIVALGDAPAGTYHLVAGDAASTVGELIELGSARFGQPLPEIVDNQALEWALRHAPAGSWRRKLERASVFFPYFRLRMRFDDSRAREHLEPRGVRPEPLRSYFDRLMDYAERAGWGQRPLSRRDAWAAGRKTVAA
jgi:thioester reductase-like protein